MHTVELLEQALAVAKELGYSVRMEWLGGAGGGACEIKGQAWLFLDLAQSPGDQLEEVVCALHRSPQLASMALSPDMRRVFGFRKSA